MRQRIAMLFAAAGTVLAFACSQSDPGITTAVKAKFAADDTVKAYQIDVDTSNKVVTLSGSVETPAAKEQAVMIARGTNGVRDVVDHLTVNAAAATAGQIDDEVSEAARELREEAAEATDRAKAEGREALEDAGAAADRAKGAAIDAAITTAVKTKLLADTSVSGLKIDVDTNAGVVTLNGSMSSRMEADHAVKLARETDGVKRVVDHLKVNR